ncbi:MAG TPA: sugar phosphate isomerase/epimerase [Acetobacteraceae bacterium]|nr:sugar phosphate isomerase/epimerase [Acetobacteraceae bacterium]
MSPGLPDIGKRIGMSLIAPRADLETSVAAVRELGFDGMEVHIHQLGPGLPGVPVFEAHAEAAGNAIRRAGLVVSALNAVGDITFDPFHGPEALARTIDGLSAHLRWAKAMGAPRVLIWEGRIGDPQDVGAACGTLARLIEAAIHRSGLENPPSVSCELHPFTFALKHRAIAPLASALRSVGAGICFDFCHFGVALGRDLLEVIDDDVLDAINHVHYANTDTKTSELHFPPNDGVLDLEAIGSRLKGKPIAISWDLFGWPEPRHAARSQMAAYEAFVRRHAASLGYAER